jgi:hypothetical protein
LSRSGPTRTEFASDSPLGGKWIRIPVSREIGSVSTLCERVLDQLFARGEITSDRLAAETLAIGETQGRLRSVHLAAHLDTRLC